MDNLPMSFGKVTPKVINNNKIEASIREVVKNRPKEGGEDEYEHNQPVPSSSRLLPNQIDQLNQKEFDSNEESENENEIEGLKEGSDLPVTHEIIMKDHSKTVSALSIDPSGTRIISGSYDYDCKLWDFGGMNSNFKPFRSWEVTEGHQIHDVAFSLNGDSFLVASGSSQAKLFDRNGIELTEFIKGDVYMRDLRNTTGHTAALTGIAWHPKKSQLFLTCSTDSTLRIWELSNKRKSKSIIVVKSKERGGRTKITCCAWSLDGKQIAGACEDGSLHIWNASSNFARPNVTGENCHEKGTSTSCIVFSADGKTLASRGGDGTVKLWDTKSFKKPLFTATNLPSLNPETNLIFSPDEKYILTGTSGAMAGILAGANKEIPIGEGGKVVVLKVDGLEVVRKLDISSYSVVRVLWHPKINQILTGSSDGSIHVLYSPLTSLKGVTLALTKAPKARAIDDYSVTPSLQIQTPHSLPMFKDDIQAGRGPGKRRREKDRMDPVKTLRPLPPMNGPGRGGRVGASADSHVVKGIIGGNTVGEDPREALLKFATDEPNEFTKAWDKNQPKTIFDTRPDEAEEDIAREVNRKAKVAREARMRENNPGL